MKNLLSILVVLVITALLLIFSTCDCSQPSSSDEESKAFDCTKFCSFMRECGGGTKSDWINCISQCETEEGTPLDNPVYKCFDEFSDYPDDCAAFHECAFRSDDDTLSGDDSFDDDSDYEMTCAEAYDMLYTDCQLGFFDEDNHLIPVEDVIAYCETGDPFYGIDAYDCIADNQGDCDSIEACLGALL